MLNGTFYLLYYTDIAQGGRRSEGGCFLVYVSIIFKKQLLLDALQHNTCGSAKGGQMNRKWENKIKIHLHIASVLMPFTATCMCVYTQICIRPWCVPFNFVCACACIYICILVHLLYLLLLLQSNRFKFVFIGAWACRC